jgi:hypothetical protein
MLAVVKAIGPQLTGARAELSLLTEQQKTATTGLEQARLPEQRLVEAVQVYERAAADLAALKAAHMAAVSDWLADPQGSTPPLTEGVGVTNYEFMNGLGSTATSVPGCVKTPRMI